MKNNKILLLIVVFIALSTSHKAQVFFSSELGNKSNLSSEIYYSPQLSFYAEIFDTKTQMGFYTFSLLTETWGQAYAGILFNPTKWFTLSFGAGFETADDPYRFNINFLIEFLVEMRC